MLGNDLKNSTGIWSASRKDGIFVKSSLCGTSRQSASVKFVKTWMSSLFSSESRDPSYVGFSHVPRKNFVCVYCGIKIFKIVFKVCRWKTLSETYDRRKFWNNCKKSIAGQYFSDMQFLTYFCRWICSKVEFQGSLSMVGCCFHVCTKNLLPRNPKVGLSNPSQTRWPRDTYVCTRWRAFHASVASFICATC